MAQHNGTIKYVNPQKGFGFITPDTKGTPDVFFSFDQLRGNAARLPNKGETVIYDEGMGKRGPIAMTVYNMADPLAVEDHARDLETAKRLQESREAVHAGRKAFTEALYERNRQWHAARQRS